MEEGQTQHIYTELSAILEQHKCGWVLEQVDEQVRLGILEEKQIQTFEEVPEQFLAGSRPFKTGKRKAKYTGTRDYTESEKLLLLLEAMERAIVDVTETEEEVFKLFIEREESAAPEIILVNEATGMTKGERRVAPQPDRLAAARRLRSLIAELREEVM